MKKVIWALVLIGLVGAGSAAAWRWWKIAQTNALPDGIVSGNGRIESIQVDVAAKYGGRIKEILAREGDLVEEGQVLARMDTDGAGGRARKGQGERRRGRGRRERGQTAPSREDESELKLAEEELNRSQNLVQRKESSRGRNTTSTVTTAGDGKASLDGAKAKLTFGEPVDERRAAAK